MRACLVGWPNLGIDHIPDNIVGHRVVLLATISPLAKPFEPLLLPRNVRLRFRNVLLGGLLSFRRCGCTYAIFRRCLCGIASLVVGKSSGFVQPVSFFRPSASVVEEIPC